MKSLPRFVVPLSLLALSLASVSCATPANRRALYFSTKPHGPWTDYERRREAEATTGVVGGAATETTTGPATKQPKTAPVVVPPAVVTPSAVTPPTDVVPAPTVPAPDASGAPAAVPPAQ